MKSLILIITNTKRGTFHPVILLESPIPGGGLAYGKHSEHLDGAARYKSKMHHTSGFDTREAAIENANNNLAPRVKEAFPLFPDMKIDTDYIVEWDGEGIPALNIIY